MDANELKAILDLHQKWLNSDHDGKRADLGGAYLGGANLGGANLRSADLGGAYLGGANLMGADLGGAYLGGANLRSANLMGANLRSADLGGAKNIPDYVLAVTSILSDGDIVGWKKLSDGKIVKLLIPANAKRSNATGRKCRAEFAKVLEIWDGDKQVDDGISQYDPKFTYRVGETVIPDSFDDDRWNECSHGIHFFITRYEAENYY